MAELTRASYIQPIATTPCHVASYNTVASLPYAICVVQSASYISGSTVAIKCLYVALSHYLQNSSNIILTAVPQIWRYLYSIS